MSTVLEKIYFSIIIPGERTEKLIFIINLILNLSELVHIGGRDELLLDPGDSRQVSAGAQSAEA